MFAMILKAVQRCMPHFIKLILVTYSTNLLLPKNSKDVTSITQDGLPTAGDLTFQE